MIAPKDPICHLVIPAAILLSLVPPLWFMIVHPSIIKGRDPTLIFIFAAMSQVLSVIIPAYNEEQTIHQILDRVIAVKLINGIRMQLVIVNDCSRDSTEEKILEYKAGHPQLDLQYHSHKQNQGKGAALHTGIEKATGDFIIIQDADLEYDPQEYNTLLQPMLDGFADVVYGSRFIGGKPHRILFFWHSIGNKFLTFLSNIFTNLNLTDMETCYKLFRREMIQSLV